MFKKETSIVTLQIHNIQASCAYTGQCSILLKRSRQSIETEPFVFDSNKQANINTAMLSKCHFKLNMKKEWKEKVLKLKIIQLNQDLKIQKICSWKIDVSVLQRKDSFTKILSCNKTRIGDVTLKLTMYIGEPPKAINTSKEKKGNHKSLPLKLYKVPSTTNTRINEDALLPHETALEELRGICKLLNTSVVEYVNNIPNLALKVFNLLEITDLNGIDYVVKGLSKLNHGNLKGQVYSGLSALYLYSKLNQIYRKSILDQSINSKLLDSLNESFDLTIQTLFNTFNNSKKDEEITLQMNNEISKLGEGKLFTFYKDSLEFAYLSLFDKERADHLYKLFNINDLEYARLISSKLSTIDSKSTFPNYISPFAEQITYRVLSVCTDYII
ncbi:hypothetical protein TRFO_06022 [Tritrichomonas foetus]|uniref:C2 NT-type domain-containing protein n=1 Tax=Tritrichomonas foetus TaxID=1144522 RepID=A0A1J4K1C9_9EUKA|nr:hypothetical protein TRFO_06022 [Tritrichomonas foetus]|eukprot:OHT05043.1 hypothetical protein TRFO_06022 [Tritrichomonas foetus]